MTEKETILAELLPFWRELEDSDREAMIRGSVKRHFHPTQMMHAGREDCTGLFLVLEGRVRAYMISESGREVTLFRLLERDVCLFSASCILKDITFDLFITAETECEVMVVSPAVFDRISSTQIAAANFTKQLLSSRFSDVMWVMEQVLFTGFDKRLARFLLEEANMEGSDVLTVTHEEIANHLGSAREVVSRMLRYFSAEGLVQPGRGCLQLTDRKGLRSLCGDE